MEHLLCSILQRVGETALCICSNMVVKTESRLLPLLSAHEQSPQREEYLVAAQFSNPALSSGLTGDHPRCRSVISVHKDRIKFSQGFLRAGVEKRHLAEEQPSENLFVLGCHRQFFCHSFKEEP